MVNEYYELETFVVLKTNSRFVNIWHINMCNYSTIFGNFILAWQLCFFCWDLIFNWENLGDHQIWSISRHFEIPYNFLIFLIWSIIYLFWWANVQWNLECHSYFNKWEDLRSIIFFNVCHTQLFDIKLNWPCHVKIHHIRLHVFF